MSTTSDKDKKRLETYGKLRPRIGRGANWAGRLGLLVNLVIPQGHGPTVNRRLKFTIPAVALGMTGGYADRVLEEKLKQNKKMAVPALRDAYHLPDGGKDVLAEVKEASATFTSLAKDQLPLENADKLLRRLRGF